MKNRPDPAQMTADLDGTTLVFSDPASGRRVSECVLFSGQDGRELASRMKTVWNLVAGIPGPDLAANRVHVVDPSAEGLYKLYALAVEALELQAPFPTAPWKCWPIVRPDGKPNWVLLAQEAAGEKPGLADTLGYFPDVRVGEFLARLRSLVPGLAEGVLAIHADNERLRAVIASKHKKGGR